MTIALDLGPQDAASLQRQLNVLKLQVNALAGVSTLTESVAPQDVSTLLDQLNTLVRQINDIGGSPALALVPSPQSLGTLNAELNALRLQINAISFGGGYTAPLDIVPGAVVAYSQRAMSAAKRGTALYSIADGAGGATQSFNSDATTGLAPVAAIQSYSATPFVALWKNQGSADDAVQATGSKQPSWAAASFNGLPCLSFDFSAGQFLATAGDVTFATGEFYFVFTINTPNTGNGVGLMGENYSTFTGDEAYLANVISPNANQLLYDSSDPGNADEAGALYNNASDPVGLFGAPAIVEFAWRYGSRTLRVNGVEYVPTSVFDAGGPLGSFSHRFAVGAVDAVDGLASFDGLYAEMSGWQVIPSDADQTAIRQNTAAHYGITLP